MNRTPLPGNSREAGCRIVGSAGHSNTEGHHWLPQNRLRASTIRLQGREPHVHLQACKQVNVFPPNNQLELMSLESITAAGAKFSQKGVLGCAMHFLNSGTDKEGTGCIVARCGEHGSLVVARNFRARWFPPVHADSLRVVDATGAGNAFLRGFTASLVASRGDIVNAMMKGTLAASFVIEQFRSPDRSGNGDNERWHGLTMQDREQEYRQRL
ncbi:Ribokinase-like protein [Apiospora phragmitis]|uniref:Ribokinase-like protein n=1 Tax=Apiospora phragmitis TaxID=2905665 RepID=A0ABR1T8C7_9PEZI